MVPFVTLRPFRGGEHAGIFTPMLIPLLNKKAQSREHKATEKLGTWPMEWDMLRTREHYATDSGISPLAV